MNNLTQIKHWVEEKLSEFPNLFLVDISGKEGGKIHIVIDGDEGVNVQELAQISRFVGFKIEEANLINQAYILDVTSPGVDSPIQYVRQLPKHIGRTLEVVSPSGDVVEGKLIAVEQEVLTIEQVIKIKGKKNEAQTVSFPFSELKKVKVLVSFK